MSDYRFTHLTGRVSHLNQPRTHLSGNDIDADLYARKLLRNSAPSLCSVVDEPVTRFSPAVGGNKRTSVLESGRYFGSSLLSPTTAVGDFRERQQNMHHGRYQTALPDVNNSDRCRSSTTLYSSGLENSFRPYVTTRSVDVRTCPGRPKVFQPSHVTSVVTNCPKCFNGKQCTIQVLCPHVLERCNTFGGAFKEQLFGQYRDVDMEKQFN
ncbi:uncharacterized protein LOC111268090 isoform X2 [Varroa jacobsoni]|uniref:Uncharacterized protein n=1 Tax=Varroa destructor TaxID=109461 RepID=A0A7M7L812_VARDE|nr:uncharacterized protein LOC111255573 isoform X2 [Varroa destructor]XP_022702558.1 uncharacterized protein LOC111268090 isoform X2 [Varroa jacobsoni]